MLPQLSSGLNKEKKTERRLSGSWSYIRPCSWVASVSSARTGSNSQYLKTLRKNKSDRISQTFDFEMSDWGCVRSEAADFVLSACTTSQVENRFGIVREHAPRLIEEQSPLAPAIERVGDAAHKS